MKTTFDQMTALGLHEKWLSYGYVDAQLIADQYNAFCRDENEPLEHFRVPVYARFFNRFNFNPIPAKDFDQYLELVALDPDNGLLSWALSWVVENPNLTADQFRALAVHPLVATSEKHAFFLERNRNDSQ